MDVVTVVGNTVVMGVVTVVGTMVYVVLSEEFGGEALVGTNVGVASVAWDQ
jgi:hypothetical protein